MHKTMGNRILNSSFGWEASNIPPLPPASRQHCPKFQFCLHIQVQPPTQPRSAPVCKSAFKQGSKTGSPHTGSRAGKRRGNLSRSCWAAPGVPIALPAPRAAGTLPPKHHKSDKANPVPGDNLFST